MGREKPPYMLLNGDCLKLLKTLPAESVDALITDPPAGIGFMGKAWDGDKGGWNRWISWLAEVLRQAMRVMKPGAHGFVWALPRMSHWTGMACELAEFEVRDVCCHIYGTGFPKSLDIGKALDGLKGAVRPIVGYKDSGLDKGSGTSVLFANGRDATGLIPVTAPVTASAIRWQGWGSALKPAAENWILIRKPLAEDTVAGQVLATGTGGINVGACRVGDKCFHQHKSKSKSKSKSKGVYSDVVRDEKVYIGRFPPNLLFSHSPDCTEEQCMEDCPVAELGRQSGHSSSSSYRLADKGGTGISYVVPHPEGGVRGHDDQGTAARFFPCFYYCPKPSTKERDGGLNTVPKSSDAGALRDSGRGKVARNTHPTVKAAKFMRWLCRLITPPGGIVLDPFVGSSTTGCACAEEGFRFIGIEKSPEYYRIAFQRVSYCYREQKDNAPSGRHTSEKKSKKHRPSVGRAQQGPHHRK